MIKSRSIALLCLLALPVPGRLAASDANPGPVVDVTGGSVQGRLLPDGVGSVFKGIPFAQPPVGDLRWREPMPVVAWTGIRDAGTPGAPAEQASFGWNDKAAAASSEDCLYLNVLTPGGPAAARHPVMVWVHGGGNTGGAGGADPLYDSPSLIAHGVVLVVIEYRLGIFGFFAHPELARESPHHASGNYALLDQIAALQWVHDNISKFGGDPGNVTVFGQSAGCIDVLALMASPLSRGLFQKAIGESGGLTARLVQSREEAEQSGVRAAEKLNAPPHDTLAYLRSLPAAEVLKAGAGVSLCTTDGWVFPQSPFDAWSAGKEHPVPLLIGTNAIEIPAKGSPDEIRESIRTAFRGLAPKAIDLYGLSGDGFALPVDPLYGDTGEQWGSDRLRCVSIVLGEWHRKAGNPVWEYEFDRAIPPRPKVAHSGELAYVFGNLSATGSQAGDFQEVDRKLSATLQGYWTNFAKTGDPNGPGLPPWPLYDKRHRTYLDFTTAADAVAARDERGPFTELFRKVMNAHETH
jgi:para-nitrobenzyl esterase